MVLFEKHGINDTELFRSFSFKDDYFPCHFHRAFEIIIVRNGQMWVGLDNERIVLDKQQLALIFPNEIHELKKIDNTDTEIVLFSPELIGDFFTQYKGYAPKSHVVSLNGMPDFKTMTSVYKQKGFIYTICGKLIEGNSFYLMEGTNQTKIIYQILGYIDSHFKEDCSLEAVAENLKYDYFYLSKLFVKRMKMTFTEYLNQYRILYACFLLKNTDSQIGDIAAICGYNNLKTFHRNFHRILDKSPSMYRQFTS